VTPFRNERRRCASPCPRTSVSRSKRRSASSLRRSPGSRSAERGMKLVVGRLLPGAALVVRLDVVRRRIDVHLRGRVEPALLGIFGIARLRLAWLEHRPHPVPHPLQKVGHGSKGNATDLAPSPSWPMSKPHMRPLSRASPSASLTNKEGQLAPTGSPASTSSAAELATSRTNSDADSPRVEAASAHLIFSSGATRRSNLTVRPACASCSSPAPAWVRVRVRADRFRTG
jgi:hypothetical protein